MLSYDSRKKERIVMRHNSVHMRLTCPSRTRTDTSRALLSSISRKGEENKSLSNWDYHRRCNRKEEEIPTIRINMKDLAEIWLSRWNRNDREGILYLFSLTSTLSFFSSVHLFSINWNIRSFMSDTSDGSVNNTN